MPDSHEGRNQNKGAVLPTGLLYSKLAVSICVAVLIALQLTTRLEFTPETIALVIIAVLPWVSSFLRSVELPGGGKVTFREDAPPVPVQDAFEQVYRQIDDLQDKMEALHDTAELAGTEASPESPRETPIVATRKIILWVDDKPQNNAFEIAKLRAKDYTVVESTSTDNAMKKLQERSGVDVIITDMGRAEGNSYVQDAGVQLIKKVRDAGFEVPVFCYTTPNAAQKHYDQIKDAGGNGATASPTELFKLINRATMGIEDGT
jgi:CheY-like chemotaxis protein